MVDHGSHPDMMGDRPARDHHHADDHLDVLRLAVAAVAVLSEVGNRALEVGAGDVVEDQVGLEAEEVAEAVVESDFDPVLGGDGVGRGCGTEASSGWGWMRTHRRRCRWGMKRRPLRSQTKWVSASRRGRAHFAGRGEPVGDEHKGTVGKGDALACPRSRSRMPESELVEQGRMSNDVEDGGIKHPRDRLELGSVGITVLAGEESSESSGSAWTRRSFESEVGDNALLDLTAFAVGLDDADVFVDGAA